MRERSHDRSTARLEPAPGFGAHRPGEEVGTQVSAEAQPSATTSRIGRRIERRSCRLLQVRGARDQRRDRGQGGPDDVLRHGLHHLPERGHPRRRVQARPGRRRRRLGRDSARRGHRDHRDGDRRQLPPRAGRRSRDQRDRRLLADRARPDAAGRDGRDRPRRPRRHAAGHRRLPGSGHERGAARAQEGDRRRHRPVHPVHRLRRRRVHRHAPGRHADRGPGLPDHARPVPVPGRPAVHHGPVRPEDPRRPDHLDLRHHRRGAPHRHREGAGRRSP